ncbi:phosphoglucose isomerase [Helicosporidium sp. ATCC 50920]|nr:phosphoglucose isomerase [Helicosporidium sp. ATCC 50920]|eukprot:KDD74481.1 phosphoglucose isomerase [Helicosporidium sp. ATCC 50920]
MDEARTDALTLEREGIYADFSRQNAEEKTLDLLEDFARERRLPEQIAAQLRGEVVNGTEGRAVLHTALRAARDEKIFVGGKNVVPEVHAVLDKIRQFSDAVRQGRIVGSTGRPLRHVVSVGIGGSYLGPEFVHEALRTDGAAAEEACGRSLRFWANVDPVDGSRALQGLDPAETLVVVVSKTFTTTETMVNARACRSWLVEALGERAVARHMVAVSTNLEAVAAFGIDPANAFGFWDWVGGRYSVCSAVGALPLALQYGFSAVEAFLSGARAMDRHFGEAPLRENLPVLLALFSVWNSTFLGRPALALLPYAQALARFPAHIQQVSMESLGKAVAAGGERLPFAAGEVVFGEPGTNGQHSFYQLIHQGRTVPAEFIGALSSQQPRRSPGDAVSAHDELMCNLFAQADALALGKSARELQAEGVAPALIPHKTFEGNRPSSTLLLPRLDAHALGQLLALYEHRVAAQGMLWGLNAFDQWGVELGKVLASKVRDTLQRAERGQDARELLQPYCPATRRALSRYLAQRQE